MENIIEKLKLIKDNDNKKDKTAFDNWTLEEEQQLLDLYLIISKKESHIFNLIYRYHGCDSWEDIFRDYKIKNLKDKADGVEIAIEEIMKQINREKQK
jgi:hypothetical protein